MIEKQNKNLQSINNNNVLSVNKSKLSIIFDVRGFLSTEFVY